MTLPIQSRLAGLRLLNGKGEQKNEAENVQKDELEQALSGPLRKSYATLGAVAFSLIVFAVAIPVASAVVANGTVNPIGERRVIEHPTGGTITSISVREGDEVEKGTVLAVVDDTDARAVLAVTQNRFIRTVAEQTRLEAERSGATSVSFDGVISDDLKTSDTASIFASEVERFRSRITSHQLRVDVLRQRIEQRNEQIAGLEVQLDSVIQQADITRDEYASLERLFERRLVPKARMLELQRRAVDLEGQSGSIKARIAEAREAIGETQLQIATLDEVRVSEIDTEIADVRAQRLQLQEELRAREATVRNGTVVAPIKGIVTNIRTTAEGGVLGAGEAILDIVPSEENLIIEAMITPRDVDGVSVGQDALVMFTGLPQRTAPRVEGTVKSVSPDAYSDPATGTRTFRVLVEVEDTVASDKGLLALRPGMPAQVFFTAEDRSVLGYLLEPLTLALSRTFRES
ncbi:MAG: HlyD family type I secretion periplasmic adaptor subunit [Pseudomonadota bacterium]